MRAAYAGAPPGGHVEIKRLGRFWSDGACGGGQGQRDGLLGFEIAHALFRLAQAPSLQRDIIVIRRRERLHFDDLLLLLLQRCDTATQRVQLLHIRCFALTATFKFSDAPAASSARLRALRARLQFGDARGVEIGLALQKPVRSKCDNVAATGASPDALSNSRRTRRAHAIAGRPLASVRKACTAQPATADSTTPSSHQMADRSGRP